uniref:G-protein coupled receptors family 1 profile domain-containing protein n=1 Tax=Petromyzon marinus TaxID=7757 RepID=S4RVM9_PETMA
MDTNSTEIYQPAPPGVFIVMDHFEGHEKMKPVAFVALLVIYAVAVLGNLLLFVSIAHESQLHKPMYIFIASLSLNSMCASTITLPQIMHNLLSSGYIPITNCIAQMFFLHVTSMSECFILTSMLITSRKAMLMCIFSAVISVLLLAGDLILISRLTFCRPRIIVMPNCDCLSLSNIGCEDITINIIYSSIITGIGSITSVCTILYTYSRILYDCQNSSLRKSQKKAIYTCITHFFVLSIFYVFLLFMIFHQRLKHQEVIPALMRSAFSSFYYIFPPVLNPIIYGLRMVEIRQSLAKVFHGNSVAALKLQS